MNPLQILQERAIQAAKEAGLELFLGIPDAWYEPEPNYGCANAHVSRMYIKSETHGNLCPRCQEPVAIIPHGYTDDTLRTMLQAIAGEQTGDMSMTCTHPPDMFKKTENLNTSAQDSPNVA